MFAAAERHGLPVGVHAGSTYRHPPSAGGWGSTYLEDYVSAAQGFAAVLNSLIAEGVFVKFPGLKVVLIESGVTWLPACLWRMDKTWRGVRAEVPWVERRPSETIREHVRLTIQPFDDPPEKGQVETILQGIGSDEMLLFSTDYPHWRFDGDDAVPAGLPPGLMRKMLVDNALSTYSRLNPVPEETPR
jgi:predicted TIM-barrel fold metal-dependent hydrolase